MNVRRTVILQRRKNGGRKKKRMNRLFFKHFKDQDEFGFWHVENLKVKVPVSAFGISRLCRDGHMSNMTDAGQSLKRWEKNKVGLVKYEPFNPMLNRGLAHLSSESIGWNRWEVVKRLQFTGGKTFTHYFHVFLLCHWKMQKQKSKFSPGSCFGSSEKSWSTTTVP